MIGNVAEWIEETDDDEGFVKGWDWRLLLDSVEGWMGPYLTLSNRAYQPLTALHGVRCVRGAPTQPEYRLRELCGGAPCRR